ncbi:serine/threonine-protein kinase [Methylomarinum vadi]|uniref:serine/threonine-protein kinase n=1 Tax=Methylomarinum vadi TaxID=438855 RepID=UPI00068CF571|nr:serine/threonine-protein kinase [Methylomarinum vadi]
MMHSPEDNDQATRLLGPAPANTTDVTSTDTKRKQLSTGSLLKDRFELLEEIARGGMGTVYKALDKRDIEAEQTTFLAVKVLNDELQADNALLKALHSEAKKSQELAHPNIVTVYDFDRVDNHIFMMMEYMDGVSLDQVIRGNPNGLPLDQALSIIDQLAMALAHAHSRHIIHSDFKPSNVFVGRDKRVKVIDFGIARVVKSERKEKFDAAILRGLTPAYASLEMFHELVEARMKQSGMRDLGTTPFPDSARLHPGYELHR